MGYFSFKKSQHHSALFVIAPEFVPRRSKIIFNSPEEEDVGIYSCLVTHTDGTSSSYTLSEEGWYQTPEKNCIQLKR